MKTKMIAALLTLTMLLAACGGDDLKSIPESTTAQNSQNSAVPTAVPTTTQTAKASTLKSTKETSTSAQQTSGGVVVTVSRLAVADYAEFYSAQDAAGKRALDAYKSSTEGAVTIGQIQLAVENTTANRINIYPNQGTVIAGSEQVDAALVLSDDVGGEFFPGVKKEGRVFFFLNRVKTADISNVTYVIDAPSGQNFSRIGPEIQFALPVSAPSN